MEPITALGPDDMPPLFYQYFWSLIGEDVCSAVLDCLNNCKIPKGAFGWEDGKVGGQKMKSGQKSGKIEKILFSLICVWLGGWKNGGIENFFVLLRKESERIEYVIYIN